MTKTCSHNARMQYSFSFLFVNLSSFSAVTHRAALLLAPKAGDGRVWLRVNRYNSGCLFVLLSQIQIRFGLRRLGSSSSARPSPSVLKQEKCPAEKKVLQWQSLSQLRQDCREALRAWGPAERAQPISAWSPGEEKSTSGSRLACSC